MGNKSTTAPGEESLFNPDAPVTPSRQSRGGLAFEVEIAPPSSEPPASLSLPTTPRQPLTPQDVQRKVAEAEQRRSAHLEAKKDLALRSVDRIETVRERQRLMHQEALQKALEFEQELDEAEKRRLETEEEKKKRIAAHLQRVEEVRATQRDLIAQKEEEIAFHHGVHEANREQEISQIKEKMHQELAHVDEVRSRKENHMVVAECGPVEEA